MSLDRSENDNLERQSSHRRASRGFARALLLAS